MKIKSAAAAAAVALSMFGLGASSAPASADIYFGFTAPGFYAPAPVIGVVPAYRYRTYRPARVVRKRSCRPVYRTRHVHRPGRGWRRTRVRVGRDCRTVWR